MFWTLVIAVIVFLVAVAAMAIGVIVSNRRITGSCGGLANMKDSQGRTICDACTDPSPDCAGEPLEESQG
ncbi:MAG: (Na+)-NQR maturation NqrM [Lacipirellulaceae bacterium]